MFNFPRRKWVVESRPAASLGIGLHSWNRSLGPYFRKKTAEDMMRRCKWFSPASLVDWRVNDLG